MFGARYFGPWYFGERYFGKVGLVVDGAYNGSGYFGKRYFGQRYFGGPEDSNPFSVVQTTGISVAGTLNLGSPTLVYTAEFDVTQTTGIGLAGVLNVNGSPVFEDDQFIITPPLDFTGLVGALTVAGDIVISAPAPGVGRYNGQRYFGARYFGRRYFSPAVNFNLAQATGIGLTGTLNAAGNFTTTIGVAQTNTIGLVGVVGVSGGDISLNAVGGVVPAGKSPGRKRKKTEVEIDGQVYTVETKEDASRLLESAKQAAEEAAALAIERASKAERRPTRKVLADARKALQAPVIDADEALRSEVEALQQEIADIYSQALQTVEIAALMRKAEIEEDDEDVLLLIS
jgi:uncharacterized membrane protein